MIGNPVESGLFQKGKSCVVSIYNEFNTVCNNQLGKSFGEVLSMVPEAALQKKPSPAEKREKKP